MPAQIGFYDTLKSTAGKVFAYLASITLTGTDGKTITVTQDTALDEVVSMSSKAPKASPTFTTKITTPIVDLTGGQIAFPAVQAASADANTLDDYEEGTWTGELRGSGSRATTPVEATGVYTKIGRKVTVLIAFQNKNTTGATGEMQITGLPFSAGNYTLSGMGSCLSYGLNVPALFNTPKVEGTSTVIGFISSANNGDWMVPSITAAATKYIYVGLTYFV